MRFLFVYVTQAGKARDLVKSLGVTDIEVIVVRKKEDYPNCEEINKIGKDQPSAAICQVVRAYKRNITSIVNIEFETNTFRVDDQRLKAWLSPPKSKIVHIAPAPSQVLLGALAQCNRLILAPGADANIDLIHQRRWTFVEKAFALLCRHAQGEPVGPMREWLGMHGINYAANGQVGFCCRLRKQQPRVVSYWHLKDGDHTSPEDAPRIYFDHLDLDDGRYVVITYAGPHPKNGVYTVELTL